MTAQQVESYCNQLWNTDSARIAGYRLSGNRTANTVIDGNGHHMPLEFSYNGGYTIPGHCPPMCACLDDLMDCTIPVENDLTDAAQRWTEQRGG